MVDRVKRVTKYYPGGLKDANRQRSLQLLPSTFCHIFGFASIGRPLRVKFDKILELIESVFRVAVH